jgi:hypothetical protein
MADRAKWTDARLDLVDRIDKHLESLDIGVRDLRGEMRALRSELRGEIGALRAEVRGGVGYVRGGIGELRSEISAVRRDGMITTAVLVAAIIGTGVLT